MDTSVPAAQDVPNQTQSDQQAVSPSANSASDDQAKVSPSQTPVAQQPKKQQVSVSGGGGLEAGSGMVMAEDPDDDDEAELQVAPQEKKNLGVMGQGGDDEQGDEQQIGSQAPVMDVSEVAEIQPSVPEVVAGSPEVEKLIEITPPEQPKISDELKNIGVTHSGPGFIDAAQMNQPALKMPVTYQQAVNAEEQIKDNKLKSSKFWLLEKIKYIWRKVDPNISLALKQQPVKTMPAKTAQSKTNQIVASKVPVTNETTV